MKLPPELGSGCGGRWQTAENAAPTKKQEAAKKKAAPTKKQKAAKKKAAPTKKRFRLPPL